MDASSDSVTTKGSPKRSRRWYQPSGRTLLAYVCVVLVLVVSIPTARVAFRWQRARTQRDAVEAIEGLGGLVLYEEAETRISPLLRRLLGDGFFYLKVHSVYLRGTQVTDAGLEHLKELTDLQELDLNHTQVTDAGLEHLKELTDLQKLDLNHTQVTDAGLEHLKGLTSLRRLELYGTQVTEDGVSELKNALPSCRQISHGPTQARVAQSPRLRPRPESRPAVLR